MDSCRDLDGKEAWDQLHQPGRRYIPPTTDIRPLHQTMYIPVVPTRPGAGGGGLGGRCDGQTMYIPVVPTKPGGERDVTFPMTPRTMGQPDVTSACCVPVMPCQPGCGNMTDRTYRPTSGQIYGINDARPKGQPDATSACCVPVMPCQPGFKNLTDHIYPTAGQICDGINVGCCPEYMQGPLQYMAPPNNMRSEGYVGLPDTFPQHKLESSQTYRQQAPHDLHQFRGIPNVTFPEAAVPASSKGMNISRNADYTPETEEHRDHRLNHSMFGSYGSALKQNHTKKRPIAHQSTIRLQGNGFNWGDLRHY